MRKKILAIVLALVLVAALVPATALATTITSSDTDLQKVFGETHENVTWKTEDGVTTITLILPETRSLCLMAFCASAVPVSMEN